MLIGLLRNVILGEVFFVLLVNLGATVAGYTLAKKRTQTSYENMERWGRAAFAINTILFLTVCVFKRSENTSLYWWCVSLTGITVLLSAVLVFLKKWADKNRLHRKVAIPYVLIILGGIGTAVFLAN
ncbi:MAG: hypothetical protein AB203_02410 [Parcubacteria bacterium C7867-008]|nr:MAG: hypothetical protein AB203_02410 [Parcubacteria bacterium C7867-008]